MTADQQHLFNIAVMLAAFFGGWVLKSLTKSIDRLDSDVRELPKLYVSKGDFKEALREIKEDVRAGFHKVEKTLSLIFNKLEDKEDK